MRTHGNLGTLDRLGELGTREDLPPTSLLDQFDAMSIDVVVLTQFIECCRDRGGTGLDVQRRQRVHRDGARGGEQGGFKQLR
jgi:hypothetical protein